MYNLQDSKLKKFFKSPHHAWLAALTLGVGFMSAHWFVMLAGLGLYAIGWLHLPDMPIFTNWVQKKDQAIAADATREQVQAFMARRQALISRLSQERMRRYLDVAEVCKDIERATRDSVSEVSETDPRLRKLDELMWTFLRLLVMEGSLDGFLNSESGEELPAEIQNSQAEIARLEAEIKTAGADPLKVGSKSRLLESKKERWLVLTKRQERIAEAKDNRTLISAEQDRLVEQIKLLRADAIAAKNAEALTARIDATVDHLTETNKLFTEMDQFKDLVAEDMPQTSERLGYTTERSARELPPELPARPPERRRDMTRN